MPKLKKDLKILDLNTSSRSNCIKERHALISFIQTNANSLKQYKEDSILSPSNSFNDVEKEGVPFSQLEYQCRICLISNMSNTSKQKSIISPCRCSGTMKFVHTSCLTVNIFLSIFIIKFFLSIGLRSLREKDTPAHDVSYVVININESLLLM